jgi:hypothetical protein
MGSPSNPVFNRYLRLKHTQRETYAVTPFIVEIKNAWNNTTTIYLSIYLSLALQPFVGPWPIFQFLDLLHSR